GGAPAAPPWAAAPAGAPARAPRPPALTAAAGPPAPDRGEAFADAVETILERSAAERRDTARARAECFGWRTAVEAFLDAHDAPLTCRRDEDAATAPARRVVPGGVA
ncbi:glycosyltransferase family 1 protein, partial [Streptomyces sp. NPDC127079]